MSRPQVSIVVVNWNGEDFLLDCIKRLTTQSYSEREVILVDNGSTDASVPLVREKFPTVKIVELGENKGFTGGNIQGLNAAGGEYIALINNDALVDRAWLENLVQPLLSTPTIGICASKILFEDGRRIDSVGGGLTTAGVGFNRDSGKDTTFFTRPEFVFGACGAAVLYRRRMLDEIGFFDEDFFLYDEDTDLSFRAQLAGWKCVYVPSAIVYHKGNATTGRLSDAHVYFHTRNLEFVWLKNMPGALMLRFLHHKVAQEVGSFIYLCVRHGKWAAFFKAKWDALKMVRVMRQKRKEIQARRKVSNSYVRGLMSSVFSTGFLEQKLRQVIRG